MSIFYEVNEHLKVENTGNHPVILDIATYQLSLLGAWILQERAGIERMTLTADGKEYRFSGKLMTREYHDLIQALSGAEQVELSSSYWYSFAADDVDPGPFAMENYLKTVTEDAPEVLEGVFYSMHNCVDCGTGAGTLVAYGEKGGKCYKGLVPFASVSEIPEGVWTTPDTAVCYEGEDLQGRDLNAIAEVCKKMCQFSEADTMELDEERISFFLNNLRIRNDREMKEFLRLFAELAELTDGECGLIGELADCSGPDAKVLHFDVDADGNPVLEMAQITG